MEGKYTHYRDECVFKRINATAGAEPVAIDEETQGLIAFADACHRQSGGAFDPTSGVLRRAWRFDVPRAPSREELAPLLSLIGWQRVEVRPGRVRLPQAGMELDFGGFGK